MSVGNQELIKLLFDFLPGASLALKNRPDRGGKNAAVHKDFLSGPQLFRR